MNENPLITGLIKIEFWIWCSCWCILVEEQEDLSWRVGDSNCNLGSLWVDGVSLTHSCLPCFDFLPCRLVLVGECHHVYQQVSLNAISWLHHPCGCFLEMLFLSCLKSQVSSTHSRGQCARTTIPSGCCCLEIWAKSGISAVARCGYRERFEEIPCCMSCIIPSPSPNCCFFLDKTHYLIDRLVSTSQVVAGLWLLSIVGTCCDFLTLFYISKDLSTC